MNPPASWSAAFPGLDVAGDAVLDGIFSHAALAELPAGRTVFHAGSLCDQYLLVISGSVRVQLVSESGREVVLYRVGRGESCVLTTSCLIAGERYPAEGTVEHPVTAVALGKSLFDHGLAGSDAFRRFVFANFSMRLVQVIARMEEVTYGSIDARLGRVLLAGAPRLRTTHEALALELGTAREVVSRRLKSYQSRGLISLTRGEIDILDPEALSRLAT